MKIPIKLPFKGLKRKVKIEPGIKELQRQQNNSINRVKNAEEHFEEISLDSRKRKDTTGSAPTTGRRKEDGKMKEGKRCPKMGNLNTKLGKMIKNYIKLEKMLSTPFWDQTRIFQ